MDNKLSSLIQQAIDEANSTAGNAELSLVIVKLREAQMWNTEHKRAMNKKVQERGFKTEGGDASPNT